MRVLQKKRKNGYISFIILTVIAIISCIASFFVIFTSFSFLAPQRNSTLKSTKSLTYQIKVKNNKYYDKEMLEENKEYISSAIEKVIPKFKVKIKNKKENNIKYTYQVNAILNGYTNNKLSKSKKYNLIVLI